MKRSPIHAVVALSTLSLLSACAEGQRYDEPLQPLPPVALGSSIAFVERTNARLFLLDPAAASLRPRRMKLTKDPIAAVRRNGHDELLVLCRGERGSPGVQPEPPALVLAAADGKLRTVGLGTRFDALAQSPDGRFVIAHFTQGSDRGEAIFNPNEIAIVDLMPAAPRAVARTVRSFGGVPRGVVFSPRLALPDGERTLAVVLSHNYVTLIDLDNPTRAEITVPLILPDDRRTVDPVQVLFDTSEREPTIYIRATGAGDVYALRLVEVPAAERTSNDFRPAVSHLAAGAPADMALIDTPEGRRLLVVSPSGRGEAFVIDARSSRTTAIPLDGPANQIVLFESTAPGDPQLRRRALLIGVAMDSARLVSFLDLEHLEEQRTKNLETQNMGAASVAVHAFPERGLVVVRHTAGVGMPQISVIDLGRRTVAPIYAETPIAEVTAAGDRLWTAPQGGERLGVLDLRTLGTGEVRLDAAIAAILPLSPAKDGKARLVVVHPSVSGDVTVLDATKPERETARRVSGLLYDDLLERGDL